MPTVDDLGRLALALPEVTVVGWYAERVYSVGKKGFAYSWNGQGLMRLGRDRVDFLLEARPEAVKRFPMPGGNWATVDLSVLDEEELSLLVRQAWAGVAPAKLRKAFDLQRQKLGDPD